MKPHERALSALADPTRRRIFELIASGHRSVGEIVREMTVSQPAVSQHLANLREAELVTVRRDGRTRLYRVNEAGLVAIRAYLEQMWADVLGSYQRVAEEVHLEEADG